MTKHHKAKVKEISRIEYKALLDKGWKFRPASLYEFDNPDAEIMIVDFGKGPGKRPYRVLHKST